MEKAHARTCLVMRCNSLRVMAILRKDP